MPSCKNCGHGLMLDRCPMHYLGAKNGHRWVHKKCGSIRCMVRTGRVMCKCLRPEPNEKAKYTRKY